MVGVSFVIPVRNGARWLDRVLTAIRHQHWTGPVEIIAIDDGSIDESVAILSRHEARGGLRLLKGFGTGAAAAINLGIRAAAHPLIAQVDQDVVISPDWLARLLPAFDDARIAAAQGSYVPDGIHEGSVPLRERGQTPCQRAQTPRDIWSRVMALDLALRYRRLGATTDHVCTGNSVYRRSALLEVGLFDETLGYGYDNDLSYRLVAAGHRLAYRHDAESVHHWREGVAGYLRQQYGFGYGRLDLLARHPDRVAGDDVSRLSMMLQAPLTALAILAAMAAVVASALGAAPLVPAGAAFVLATALVLDRFVAGLRAARCFRDPAGLWFVPVHLVRNVAWVAAIVAWSARALLGRRPNPAHSMRPRPDLGRV